MIQVQKFVFNPFQKNTYIVYQNEGEALIVDPGCITEDEVKALVEFVNEKGLKVSRLVNTHCHIDHIFGVESLKKIFNVKWYAHPDDVYLVKAATTHALMFGLQFQDEPNLDEFYEHDDIITIGDSTLRVIHTPGHSRGGVCLFAENEKFILTGDTLFNMSVGRTDLEGGDYETLIKSINERLLVLPDEVEVLPGHGVSTTIGQEKKANPFLI
ncbi:MAG: hydroxyacylglutathione hydrolase [Tenuifilum sp.]|uniref:MBL fold metallo-hydrolase n=1 Tax=Tenuifilum sp. TaxID=2760880 RepID=UPI0024AC41FC|nr:MBL fold metallo-hydrolase [Tenuifilum sp.]MDI3527510.1 hydroxyacylglutathione hydrolase [Tenuifilum sp.]